MYRPSYVVKLEQQKQVRRTTLYPCLTKTNGQFLRRASYHNISIAPIWNPSFLWLKHLGNSRTPEKLGQNPPLRPKLGKNRSTLNPRPKNSIFTVLFLFIYKVFPRVSEIFAYMDTTWDKWLDKEIKVFPKLWPLQKCGSSTPTVPLENKQTPIMSLPSGKRLHNYGKIHHAIHGKAHELSIAMLNYQRVCVQVPIVKSSKILKHSIYPIIPSNIPQIYHKNP